MIGGVRAACIAAICGSSVTAATAQTLTAATPASQTAAGKPSLAATAELHPVKFTRLAVHMPPGQTWTVLQTGMFCVPARTLVWSGGQSEFRVQTLADEFRTDMETAGYKVEGDPSNLFEPQTSSSDFEIAGVATDVHIRVCVSSGNRVKGEQSMTIDWQLYNRLQHQVVARVHTTGSFQIKDPEEGGQPKLMNGSFAENVKLLAASPELRAALSGPASVVGEVIRPGSEAPIVLEGQVAAPQRPVDEAVGAVVVVGVGTAQGSGVLVSSDGYVLTAAHVVGTAKDVRVRWSDGIETVGQVMRVSKPRDVAIIKTDARGRPPLAIRRDPPRVGETVFAVGAPLGQKFQGTVTRGVLSAVRVLDGFTYLQSDVTIAPGVSGGPLLDDHARVLGLAKGGYTTTGAPMGLNVFIPSRDAMDFLSLQAR